MDQINNFIANTDSVTLGILFVVLLGLAVFTICNAFLVPKVEVAFDIRDKKLEIKDKKLKPSDSSDSKFEILQNIKHKIEPLIAKMDKNKKTKKSEEKMYAELAAMLYAANINMTPQTFQFARNTITIVSTICAVFLAIFVPKIASDITIQGFCIILGAAVPYLGMKYWLQGRVKSRKEAVSRQLPDALDLLFISVDAGMHFNQALEYVTLELSGPFIDELKIAVQQMSLGMPRDTALTALAERNGDDNITSFVSAVIQATTNGWPLASTLKNQSDAIRQAKMATAKTKAAKASIKMLIPMVVFIFPVLFIVLLGPSVINMVQSGFLG